MKELVTILVVWFLARAVKAEVWCPCRNRNQMENRQNDERKNFDSVQRDERKSFDSIPNEERKNFDSMQNKFDFRSDKNYVSSDQLRWRNGNNFNNNNNNVRNNINNINNNNNNIKNNINNNIKNNNNNNNELKQFRWKNKNNFNSKDNFHNNNNNNNNKKSELRWRNKNNFNNNNKNNKGFDKFNGNNNFIDDIEKPPGFYAGRNPLQFHVEANYLEDPSTSNEDDFPRIKVKKPTPPVTIKWNSNRRPMPHSKLQFRKNEGKRWPPKITIRPKKKLVKWPFPPKLAPNFLHFPPPKLRDFHKLEKIRKDARERRPTFRQQRVSDEDVENDENDFSAKVMQEFLKNNGLNHNNRWSPNSDPEQGLKNVRVVMPNSNSNFTKNNNFKNTNNNNFKSNNNNNNFKSNNNNNNFKSNNNNNFNNNTRQRQERNNFR